MQPACSVLQTPALLGDVPARAGLSSAPGLVPFYDGLRVLDWPSLDFVRYSLICPIFSYRSCKQGFSLKWPLPFVILGFELTQVLVNHI